MTAIVFLKLWYRCGFSRDNLLLLNQWNQESVLTTVSNQQRAFLQCVNTVDLYHMQYPLPLRLDAYNSLINAYREELCCRDNVIVIENIAPVRL